MLRFDPIYLFRVRKFTSEEKLFRQRMGELEGEIARLKEKELISEEEEAQLKSRKIKLFEEFLNRFIINKRIALEYKISRLSSLMEESFISEEEFKEGKKKLIAKV